MPARVYIHVTLKCAGLIVYGGLTEPTDVKLSPKEEPRQQAKEEMLLMGK